MAHPTHMHALIYPLGVLNTTAFQEIISLAYTCKLQHIYYIAIYNEDGETPLMVARHNGHDACVALLIEAMGQHAAPLESKSTSDFCRRFAEGRAPLHRSRVSNK